MNQSQIELLSRDDIETYLFNNNYRCRIICVNYDDMYCCFDYVTNLFNHPYYINDFQFRKLITCFNVCEQMIKKEN